MIATTFSDRKVRDNALSLYGAMSGPGVMVGLLVGGVLTGTLGWRWVFFINVPIGLLVGSAWLPFAVGIVVGAGTAPKMLPHIGPRSITVAGALLSAATTFWLSKITVQANYLVDLAPAMFLLAVGFGSVAVTLTQAAVYRVDPDTAGIASALLNSAQQIGVARDLAVLAGIAATVTAASQNHGLPTGGLRSPDTAPR